MHKRYIPISEAATQNQIWAAGFLRTKMLSIGTMMTYSAVIKPALEAVVYAMECVDNGLKAILEAADKYGYTVLITADHGNADQMTETKKGKTSVRTAHSLNPVPFIIYDPDKTWTIKEGAFGLANVAPTIVKMMGLTAPACWEESMV